jgi:AraC-like DNA-binding protein
MTKIDSKIPEGPVAEKWTNYKAHQKLVNPANKRRLDIIVVGTGLAGASAAASLGEMGFRVFNFCIQDSPRRAHSIAAQGGINAAKNYQISTFFYPISTYTESFQYFVMQNYDKVKNVEEFAHLGGYTTTTFRRLFKNMYGVPVYEWILDKKREGILNDLQYTKQRISVISARYGFDSLSHFAHFCKDSFGDTPRALRKRSANGEKISIICKEQGKDQEDE